MLFFFFFLLRSYRPFTRGVLDVDRGLRHAMALEGIVLVAGHLGPVAPDLHLVVPGLLALAA